MTSPLPPEHTRPRPPRVTARKRTEAYKHEWEETLKRRDEWKKGRLNRIGSRKPRGVRGPEFVLALERASQASGDPIFAEALRAARQYGLDREFERSAARLQIETFGNPLDGHLAQVAFLVVRGKLEKRGRWRRRLSIREACKCVVAETGLPGHSFEAAVERLRKQYLAHPRSDNSPILDLDAAMRSLWARRIVEQEFLVKKRPPAWFKARFKHLRKQYLAHPRSDDLKALMASAEHLVKKPRRKKPKPRV
jgi:hypothetical protein